MPIDPCAEGIITHNIPSNTVPTGADDPCNSSGNGYYCQGSYWLYDPDQPGADTDTLGDCKRLFIRSGGDCNVNQWLAVSLAELIEETRDPVNGDDCCPPGTLWENTTTNAVFMSINNEACDCEWCEVCNAATEHTCHQAMTGDSRTEYDDYDNNVPNLPTLITNGLNPQTVVFTNPSLTRPMAVQIVWQGANGGFSFADTNGDWRAWYSIQPKFYIDGVQQNDHFRTDFNFYQNVARTFATTIQSGTGGWTHSMVLGAGATVTVTQDVTLLPSIVHNAPDMAGGQIESMPISVMGCTI